MVESIPSPTRCLKPKPLWQHVPPSRTPARPSCIAWSCRSPKTVYVAETTVATGNPGRRADQAERQKLTCRGAACITCRTQARKHKHVSSFKRDTLIHLNDYASGQGDRVLTFGARRPRVLFSITARMNWTASDLSVDSPDPMSLSSHAAWTSSSLILLKASVGDLCRTLSIWPGS